MNVKYSTINAKGGERWITDIVEFLPKNSI